MEKTSKKCSRKCKSCASGSGTRAQNRQKLRILRLKAERDYVSRWLNDLSDRHIKDLDKLSNLDKHLIRMEEYALQQLIVALNARVRFAEVKSRDMNGEILHETPVLELEFIRGPRYFDKRKPGYILKKGEK